MRAIKMKTIYKTMPLLIGLLFLSMVSHAGQTEKSKESAGTMKMQGGMGKHQGMGMMGNMTEQEKEQHLRTMQEHMLKMHELSNKILAETNPAKKEELKNEQLQLMKKYYGQMMERRMHRNMPQQQKQPSSTTKK